MRRGAVAVAVVDAAAELGSLYAIAVECGTPLFSRGEVEAGAAIHEVKMPIATVAPPRKPPV